MNIAKLQETRELLYEHAKEITQDAAHWMDFLDTAARVYRYSFPDIVLIHAQRPDASAVASYDIWSQTMHRYVKRGTKGIALIEDFRERPRLRYVYDISDTGILRGSKSPGYWQITDDMQDDMRDHLVETYDLDVERTPNLVSALIHISFDVYENHYQEITETVQDRMYQAARNGLPDYPAEMDVGSHVGMLLTNSMVYVLARRCGLNPLSVVSEEDFSQWLGGFQNFDLIDAVGQTVMEQSSQILHDIYKKTVELSNEKKKKALDNTIKKSYSTVNKKLTRDSAQGLDTSEKPTVLNLPADETVETGREYQNQNQGGQDHGDSVHSEGRISLSEPDGDGSTGRAGGDREVRRDAHEVSEGEPLRGIPQPAVPGSPEAALRRGRRAGMGETGISGTGTDETLQGSGTGSEQRLPGLRGMEEHDHEAVGGVHPEGISVHVVEVPEENKEEENRKNPEEQEETSPGFTLPELPPMEEQIRQLEKLEESSYASGLPFPEAVVDEFLRHAGHRRNSSLRIIYNFMAGQPFKSHVEFVRNEFAGTRNQEFVCRRGLYIGGIPYSARWDADGIMIAAGKSEEGKERINLSWGDVVKRIDQLLLAGQYAPQTDLDRARENAVTEHAELLRVFYRDLPEDGKNLFTHVEKSILTGPETSREDDLILDRMESPKFLASLILDLEAVAAAYEQKPSSIYRWRSTVYRPDLVLERFRNFQKPTLAFQADPKFQWKQSRDFISQETMDEALRKNNSEDIRLVILSFFLMHKDKKQRADFLKNEFGQGGWTGPDSYYTSYDGKGIRVQTAILSDEIEDVFFYPWEKAAERIAILIDQGTWLKGHEYAKIYTYERDVLAENILNFYLDALDCGIISTYAPEKTWTYAWSLPTAVIGTKKQEFNAIFADSDQAERMCQDMERVLAEMPLNARNYETCRETVQTMHLFLEGRYTLFPGQERLMKTDTLEERNAQRIESGAENETAEEAEIDADVIETGEKEEGKEQETKAGQGEEMESVSIGDRTDDHAKSVLAGEIAEEENPVENPAESVADGQNVLQQQAEKMSRKAGKKPKKRKRTDNTENLKKFHGFPDSITSGKGQQMSLFDFLGDDGKSFIYSEANQKEEGTQKQQSRTEEVDGSQPAEEPAYSENSPDFKEENTSAEMGIAGSNGMPENHATLEDNISEDHTTSGDSTTTDDNMTLRDGMSSEESTISADNNTSEDNMALEDHTNLEDNQTSEGTRLLEEIEETERERSREASLLETETKESDEEADRSEEDAIIVEIVPGEDAFLFNGTHYLITDINYTDRYVTAQDMDYTITTGSAIYETFSFTQVREFFEHPQEENQEIAEVIEDISTQEALDSEMPDGILNQKPFSLGLKDDDSLEALFPTGEIPTDIPGQESFTAEPINYHITDDTLGEGRPKEKYRRNLAAIQTLKEIESEHRMATEDEQEILAQYVGWGGIPQAFLASSEISALSEEGAVTDSRDASWGTEQKQLLDALTTGEYADARASTLTAYYTPPVIIRAMYRALSRFGFTAGNVLEPSCGIGNFMGLLPEGMDASVYGVEVDSIAGRIAGQLYQKNRVYVQPFQDVTFPDNFFDVVVGNVPFGDFSVPDARYQRNHFLIHDYFIAKCLDLVRPGGIVAVITTSGTMDKKDSSVREYIANRADLLGAIRLPNTAFTKNAGTKVVSDILFLQKRDRAVLEMPFWVKNTDGGRNLYFRFHPEMILGRVETVSGRFGMEETVLPLENEELEISLNRAIDRIEGTIPEIDVDETVSLEGVKGDGLSLPATPEVRNFSFTVVDDTVYYRENSWMNRVDLTPKMEERVKGLIELSHLVRELIRAQMDGLTDESIKAIQQNLDRQYDAFVKTFGRISARDNKRVFEKDSSYSLLTSLEIFDDEGNFERKADIFTKRTISRPIPVTHTDTASEALAVCIGELARVDLKRMSELTGMEEDEIVKELTGVIFQDPQTGDWVTADEYLSGNVRKKLLLARKVSQEFPEYAVNVEYLESVQPEELKASEIEVRIGTTWIPQEYYNEFMVETFNLSWQESNLITAEYEPASGAWNVSGKTFPSTNNTEIFSHYGTSRANALRLFEDALNLKTTKIYDTVTDDDGRKKQVLNTKATILAQQKQELICEHFKEWIYANRHRRETIERIYNEKFNSIRPRQYDGSHITFVGMTPEITLMQHQKNAVAHILYGKNTLLAHCVGAGKTYEMVAAGMECRRLGLAKKCLYVVPNHLTEQWASEFLRLYPGANILAATKKDFEPANRKRFCSRIATGDYDAVIIGHSQFEKIPLSPERQARQLNQQIDDLTESIEMLRESSGGSRFTIKQLEKTRKSLEVRLEKLNTQKRKDRVVTFEELGVDKLFVDESHSFKNLFLYTKMSNVAGISQTDAQKSSDMFAKCQYLDELTGGRGVVFATGTPVSNTMCELYTIMRYLQYDTLKELEMTHFDAWAATFGETVNAVELAPEGTGYRTKTRFAKFYNLPELTTLFREVADVKTADMLNLPVPEAEYMNEVLKPSEIQKQMVESFGKRAEKVRGGMDPRVDNMLKITNDGRKCALDERLMNDLFPDEEESKVNRCVENTFQIWQETAGERSTQIIFCDLSTPKADGSFNVYDDIRDKLVMRGVPKDEVAFIHEYNTEAKKAELFKKVRSGVVRILMGSTQKMGAGTNVQDRLIALHHLDCPWKPADLEQQEGRILRQGNHNKKVKIFRYVTEGTFDSYMWQLLESKQKFISQIMTSKSPARSAQDVDDTALSYAEIKALATGNPYIKEKMSLDIEVEKLKLAKADYTSQKYDLETKIAVTYPGEIRAMKEWIEGLKDDAAEAKKILEKMEEDPKANFQMTIEDAVYTDRKLAGERIVETCEFLQRTDQFHGERKIGNYHGFEMQLTFSFTKYTFSMTLRRRTTTQFELSKDATGNITRIHNALKGIEDRIEKSETKLADLEVMFQRAKETVDIPFEKEEELQTKQARLRELNILLDMDKSSSVEAVGVGEDILQEEISEESPVRASESWKKEASDYAGMAYGEAENRPVMVTRRMTRI